MRPLFDASSEIDCITNTPSTTGNDTQSSTIHVKSSPTGALNACTAMPETGICARTTFSTSATLDCKSLCTPGRPRILHLSAARRTSSNVIARAYRDCKKEWV